MRKKPSLYSLKRGKLRQSWNKYNLYNLLNYRPSNPDYGTFFQQKWRAKSSTRAYHGEQVLEKHWKRQFSPTLRSVTPMDPEHLARSDGSRESAGRGSGLDEELSIAAQTQSQRPSTPYNGMVYAPLERRLDVAIHRAMFASSTRQARQFVIHGFVKVNGKTLTHPSYSLNPGDMFQVDVDRVLYATGMPKDAADRRETRRHRRERRAQQEAQEKEDEAATEEADAAESEEPAATLTTILGRARDLLASDKKDLPAKRKRALRELKRSVQRAISKGKGAQPLEDAVDSQMLQLMQQLNLTEKDDGEGPVESEDGNTQNWISQSQKQELESALQQLRDNPIDPTKPYATPWQPRPFLGPFAFIPRYLEVNFKVASAIYLRHPVARPGQSEVPTPFTPLQNQLTFNWYLRRR